jgi:hypothetical protein
MAMTASTSWFALADLDGGRREPADGIIPISNGSAGVFRVECNEWRDRQPFSWPRHSRSRGPKIRRASRRGRQVLPPSRIRAKAESRSGSRASDLPDQFPRYVSRSPWSPARRHDRTRIRGMSSREFRSSNRVSRYPATAAGRIHPCCTIAAGDAKKPRSSGGGGCVRGANEGCARMISERETYRRSSAMAWTCRP